MDIEGIGEGMCSQITGGVGYQSQEVKPHSAPNRSTFTSSCVFHTNITFCVVASGNLTKAAKPGTVTGNYMYSRNSFAYNLVKILFYAQIHIRTTCICIQRIL